MQARRFELHKKRGVTGTRKLEASGESNGRRTDLLVAGGKRVHKRLRRLHRRSRPSVASISYALFLDVTQARAMDNPVAFGLSKPMVVPPYHRKAAKAA